jgi:hypothetical protein
MPWGEAAEAATPRIKLAVDKTPSFAPKTPARSQPTLVTKCFSGYMR